MSKEIPPEKGRLLISAPGLTDVFKRTVLYLTEHNETGSVGFILNKPLMYKIHEVIDDFPEFDSGVFLGGPVQSELVNYIHKYKALDGSYEISDGVFWGGNFDSLKILAESKLLDPKDFKFFLGYAGWSPEQLNDELKEKTWYVTDSTIDIIFDYEPEKLWQTVLKNMGGEYSLISTFPEDPSVN